MGQYWNIIAIDAEEYISRGKLGEFFFDNGWYFCELLSKRLSLDDVPKLSDEDLREWIALSTSS